MQDESLCGDSALSTDAWTATFADLAALLLTFFVLVYAMSSMNEERWFTLADALTVRQVAGEQRPVPPPMTELSAPNPERAIATSSAYLFAILTARLRHAGIILPVQLDHTSDGVEIGIDAGLLLDGDAVDDAFQVRELLRQIAGLLSARSNAVVIRYRPDEQTREAAAMARLIDIARALHAAGYRAPLAAHRLPAVAGMPAQISVLVRSEVNGG